MAILDVQNLTLSFGEKTLFSDVSFDIKEKEKVGLIGCNGAGKTSLFKVITGEYSADSGNCFMSRNATLHIFRKTNILITIENKFYIQFI